MGATQWECQRCGTLNVQPPSPHEWYSCGACEEPWYPPRKAEAPPPPSVPPPMPEIPVEEYDFVPDSGGLRFPPRRIRKETPVKAVKVPSLPPAFIEPDPPSFYRSRAAEIAIGVGLGIIVLICWWLS